MLTEDIHSDLLLFQLLQLHIAHLVNEKKLVNVSQVTWKDDIHLLGKLVHLLPSSSLEVFKNETLQLATVTKVSSRSLNFRQVNAGL